MRQNQRLGQGKHLLILITPCLLIALCLSACGGGSGGGSNSTASNNPDRSPTVTSVTPDNGPTTGGEHVVISGEYFQNSPKTRVYFNAQRATDVVVVNSETITCVTPPNPVGPANVRVAGPGGIGYFPSGFTYTTDPSVLKLEYSNNGNELEFTWELSRAVDEVIFYRGNDPIAFLEGDAEDFFYEESHFGFYRYTVALYEDGNLVDDRGIEVNLGYITWDPPDSSPYSGYYLYIGEAINPDPQKILPFENPKNFNLDIKKSESLSMEILSDMGFIEDSKTYFMALSSYYNSGTGFYISPLSEVVKFHCEIKDSSP